MFTYRDMRCIMPWHCVVSHAPTTLYHSMNFFSSNFTCIVPIIPTKLDKEDITILHVAAKEGKWKHWKYWQNYALTFGIFKITKAEETLAVKFILKTKLSWSCKWARFRRKYPQCICKDMSYSEGIKRVDKAIVNKNGLGFLNIIRLNEQLVNRS